MELQLVLVSFIGGVLTILAPCIFPLLPILVGASADGKSSRNRAFTVIISLLISVALLTLLIYGTSDALGLNENDGVLRAISATIVIFVGAAMLFPHAWENLSAKLKFDTGSNKLLGKAMQKDGKSRDILIGASLGPVFSSCSPTYGLIIATILPQDFGVGAVYLLWYLFGLGLMFALIAILGKRFISKLAWATDPDGWFKRGIGALFLVIGVAIIFNLDRDFETWLLQFDFYDSLVNFELELNE